MEDVNLLPLNQFIWPRFNFIAQDRNLSDENTGLSLYTGEEEILISGNRYSLREHNDPGSIYLFNDPEFLSQSSWIDLDGNITKEDGSAPLNGEQGNQSGDDLISNFQLVDYNGNFSLWDQYQRDYSVALLSDTQGQYVLIQDRNLDDGNDGTDTLRNVNEIFFQNGEIVALSPLNSWGGYNPNYPFSNPQFLSQSSWIDLDGNVTRDDGSSPLYGEQGNQSGDDLILGFNEVAYWDSGDQWSNNSALSIARLRDEQGDYFIVQDRSDSPDNQGTDTLRRVDTLNINGAQWDLTGFGQGDYYFADQNYSNKDIWIDLDGNVALIDSYGNPIPTGPGMQGNQSGDDLILGFNEVAYWDSGDQWSNNSALSIARLRDEQGD
ncbi:hypothetical protein, partial [Synechococcus sp. MU1617]|uniref:hypothetical protein n=1 Tax=Synechococcus sp. MU1617 TaxID=2508346 RepID=UPI001CF83A58